MEKTCKNCSKDFLIRDTDFDFYKRIDVPAPTLCFPCREQRRLSFRNDRVLYKRQCNLCGDAMISIHHEGTTFPVYCRGCWWSDKWDPLMFGQDFDFSRPFFEQFRDLQNKVPRLVIFANKSENSDYTCHSFQNRNCYLCFRLRDCEDLAYSFQCIDCKDCMDCYSITECQLCYKCFDCFKCYNCKYVSFAKNCSDCVFGYDLIGCRNCFGCSGLRNKEYCIFNEQKTREEYEKFVEEFDFCNGDAFSEAEGRYIEIMMSVPRKNLAEVNNENCVGDHLHNSKNCFECYDCEGLEDCAYSTFIFKDRDCYDLHGVGESELCYDSMGVEEVYNLKFSYLTYNTKNSSYCALCFNSENLFGCISLNQKKNCILNKQYGEGEYKEMVNKIIEHMKNTGEWGEFFPISICPYAYNETVSGIDYPMSKGQVLAKGWAWKEKDSREYLTQNFAVPSNIAEIDDGILKEVLACKNCGKNYKVTSFELVFYRRHKLPISLLCSDCRYGEHLKNVNKRRLRQDKCQRCDKDIFTAYAENYPGKIYCEDCYLKEVY